MRCFSNSLLILLLLATGGICCGPQEQIKSNDASIPPASEQTRRSTATKASTAGAESDMAAVVKGNNQFALNLYAQLRTQNGNLFLSPSSISTALAMTYAGARGDTARQMAATLHFTLDQQHLHPAFASLMKELKGNGAARNYQLNIANALWGQKGYAFLDGFISTAKDNYGAGLNQVDFANTEEARRTINAWVEQETQNRVKDLIKPDVLKKETRLVLTNAIYFKGNWASHFKPENTREAPFMLTPKRKVMVPTMHQGGKFKTAWTENFRALELPYAGKDLSMIVFVPRKEDGLAEFERTLTADKLDEWLSKLKENEIDVVALPKFKLTTGFELGQTLSAMGMPLAFASGADFSGMTASERLSISKVIHQAFVDVNEEGTEAAAATGTEMRLVSVSMFVVDHPFIFLIRDNRSGSLLFMGRVTNPLG